MCVRDFLCAANTDGTSVSSGSACKCDSCEVDHFELAAVGVCDCLSRVWVLCCIYVT